RASFKTVIDLAKFDRVCSSQPAACVSASSIKTPGSTGNVGKWSAKYSSARLTYLLATILSCDSDSILSIRLNFTRGFVSRSCAAIVLGMKQKRIESEVLLLSHLPRKYAFIFQENAIIHHDVESGWPEKFPFEQFDALLIADTGTWSQLPDLHERIARANWDA